MDKIRFPLELYASCKREAEVAGETFANLARRGIVEEADRMREKRLSREGAAAAG